MNPFYYILAAAIACFGFVLWRKQHRRQVIERLRTTPLPPEWIVILDAQMPIYTRLPTDLKKKLHGYIQIFLATKSFEPCGKLEEITDEMRVLVAGQACLLLLNDQNGCFDKLGSVLLYPNAYKARSTRRGDDEVGDEADSVRLGESWGTGSVVLSWHHTLHGSTNDDDGSNVVIHEFAHQLDQVDGWADGLPILTKRSSYPDWQKVFTKAFERHVQRTEAGRRTVIDAYGATNPAEFFAVSTETFFEKPRVLKKKYPDLYEQLAIFYDIDPLEWE